MGDRLVLMPKAHMERAITRMAYQIQEDHAGSSPIVLYGIRVRGLSMATRLAASLAPISTQPVRVSSILDGPVETQTDSYAVVVDDVIFSGQTMLEALSLLTARNAPRVIRMAVLVDRGHRTLPLQPDFVGLRSPTKFAEHVEVVFDAQGNPESVVLQR